MSLARELLRTEAKKVYKEQTKGVPKKSRMPFTQFFKDFKKMKRKHQHEEHDHDHVHTHEEAPVEDFNLESVVNVDNNVVETPAQNETIEVKEEEINE